MILDMQSSSSSVNSNNKKKHALIICDAQPDALRSLSPAQQETVLEAVRIALDCCQQTSRTSSVSHDDWTVIFQGLQFPGHNYGDVLSPQHRLFGALKRVNQIQGAERAHWFLEGYPGSQVDPSLLEIVNKYDNIINNKIRYCWRQSHMPSADLVNLLQQQGITHVTLVGLKVGFAVQATAQMLVDCSNIAGVTVIRDAVGDDSLERQQAVLEHVLPQFADISSLESLVDATVGLDRYAAQVKRKAADQDSDPAETTPVVAIQDLCDCGRGGHMALYASHLLQRESGTPCWRKYPLQHWYTATRSYQCPLGKKVVDFCDEPQFSRRVAMYIAGREWLDEKEKVLKLASEWMPKTYVVQGGRWNFGNDDGDQPSLPPFGSNEGDQDDQPPNLVEVIDGPWFVKECNKNGGRAIQIRPTLEDCVDLIDPSSTFVVQAHIPCPLLTKQGRKCHVKQYCLLQCDGADTPSWRLHTYQEAFLCLSPVPWSRTDLSPTTQITILRHKRLRPGIAVEEWTGWPNAYASIQQILSSIVYRAVAQGKLKGRSGKQQFEIFSADFMVDTLGKAWFIETNFGPVLFDPHAGQALTTNGLREYERLYQEHGDAVEVNDHVMMADAVRMVFYPEEMAAANTKRATLWDLVGEFRGTATVDNSNDGTVNSALVGSLAAMMQS